MRSTHFICAILCALFSIPLGLQASELGWQPAENAYQYSNFAYDVTDIIAEAPQAPQWRPSDPQMIIGSHAGKRTQTTYTTIMRALAILRSQTIHKPPV